MRSMLNHFGLAQPYRFARTLPAIAAAALFFLVAMAALYLSCRGHLTPWSPRAWYVAYLLALTAFTLIVAPWPRLAMVLVSIAALDAGFGLGSLTLFKFGFIPDEIMAPTLKWERPYQWHPLLQVKPAPQPGAKGGNAKGTATINSEGWRGPDYSAAELSNKVVVDLFGGSTTYDGQQPWSERLQGILGPSYAVLNRGMGGYTTAEHVIQTAFYERTKGVPPACSVYFIGWNDLHMSHVAGLDPGYADILPLQIATFHARRTDTQNLVSPLATMLGRLIGYAFDTARPAPLRGQISSEPDPALEEIFLRNIGAISAINRHRGIRTIWIGQLLNPAALTAETPSRWSFLRDKDVYPLIQRLNGILKKEAAALGDIYFGMPAERFTKETFYDQGHFTIEGSRLFATLLAPTIEENCRPRGDLPPQ
jgi:hypothetical protein